MSSVHSRTWLHEYHIALDALLLHAFQITSSLNFARRHHVIQWFHIAHHIYRTDNDFPSILHHTICICTINTHITCSVFDMTKVIFFKHHFLRSNLQSHSFDPASPSTHLCPSQAIKQNSNWLNVLDFYFRKKSACPRPLGLDLMQNIGNSKLWEFCISLVITLRKIW